MLTLEEAGRAKKAAQSSSAALVARSSEGPPDVPENSSSNRPTNGAKRNHNRNNNGDRSRDNTGQHGGAASSGGLAGRGGQLGGGNSRGKDWQETGRAKTLRHILLGSPGSSVAMDGLSWVTHSMSISTTAVPTKLWTAAATSSVLGPALKAYTAAYPTDIEATMHTLGITPPDANWYMDTGATSHMTSTQGFSDGEASNEV
ncbi:hypothetical protein R3W88_012319 [Solanum pinnatisectum]|uniref:Uncharacterized protein n=1 Tax=Solanum pinnatisectum TaxID=50273 RepID=A0AAV9L905_9SOLN|nr:hypothetical protein R3W88_012319 [Solanum pinnatisectum]